MEEYTTKRVKEILAELGIVPYRTNMIDSNQAAKVLSWRHRAELGIEKEYTTTALRRRIGPHLKAESVSKRLNLYDAREVFKLTLMPQKAEGAAQRKRNQTSQTA